jgi:peptidoglycan hydrolase CwlO-like protein
MKKKILSAVIAGILVLTTITPTVQVSATPTDQEITNAHNDYEKLEAKVNEANEKVQASDDQISQLAIKIDSNNNQINNINKEVENTNKEIEQAKVDISEKEDVLGKRLREVYKSGGQTNYLSLIFSADSFSDLISKIDTAGRLVNIDKKVVQEVTDNKNKLDEKVTSLGTKAEEIQNLNEDIQKQKSELDGKRAEEQVLVDQARVEQDEFNKKFMTPLEKELAQTFIDQLNNEINNPNSTASSINAIIVNARNVRDKQLKSETVIKNLNDAIEKAKKVVEEKEKASNKIASAAKASRAIVVPAGTSDVVSYAYNFIGAPYVWGATGPSTFDCSGFTSYVYRNAKGIEIGRTTYDQVNAGREVSQSELQPGDLVFPSDHHVAIYVGNGNIIHAPQTGESVKVAKMYGFWRARRIL